MLAKRTLVPGISDSSHQCLARKRRVSLNGLSINSGYFTKQGNRYVSERHYEVPKFTPKGLIEAVQVHTPSEWSVIFLLTCGYLFYITWPNWVFYF